MTSVIEELLDLTPPGDSAMLLKKKFVDAFGKDVVKINVPEKDIPPKEYMTLEAIYSCGATEEPFNIFNFRKYIGIENQSSVRFIMYDSSEAAKHIKLHSGAKSSLMAFLKMKEKDTYSDLSMTFTIFKEILFLPGKTIVAFEDCGTFDGTETILGDTIYDLEGLIKTFGEEMVVKHFVQNYLHSFYDDVTLEELAKIRKLLPDDYAWAFNINEYRVATRKDILSYVGFLAEGQDDVSNIFKELYNKASCVEYFSTHGLGDSSSVKEKIKEYMEDLEKDSSEETPSAGTAE